MTSLDARYFQLLDRTDTVPQVQPCPVEEVAPLVDPVLVFRISFAVFAASVIAAAILH